MHLQVMQGSSVTDGMFISWPSLEQAMWRPADDAGRSVHTNSTGHCVTHYTDRKQSSVQSASAANTVYMSSKWW